MSDDEDAYPENHPVLEYMQRQNLVCEVVPRAGAGASGDTTPSPAAPTRPVAAEWIVFTAQDVQHLSRLVDLILESGFLSDEDYHYVVTMRGFRIATGDAAAAAAAQASPVWRLLKVVGWLLGRALSVAAPLVAPVTARLAALWGEAVALWHGGGDERREQEAAVEALLKAVNAMTGDLHWSLTMIREREVWERRLMLMSGEIAAGPPYVAAMLSERRNWLPTLREAVREAASESMRLLVNATRRLIVMVPLTGQIDHRANYISHMEQVDLEARVEGEGSFATLKRFQTYYMVVKSEHLRRLALSFIPAMWRNERPNQLLPVYSLATSVAGGITRLSVDLNREYKLFATLTSRPLELSSVPRALVEPYAHLCLKVHDVMRHLQTMTVTVNEIKHLFDGNDEMERGTFLDQVSKRLADFKKDIDDLGTCCQEAAYETDLLRKFPLDKAEEALVMPAPQPPPQPPSENIAGTQDYVVEDEVFEGVRGDEDEGVPLGSYSDQDTVMLSEEELAKREYEKWISLSMMRELKLALVGKSKECVEREMVAVRKKQDGGAAIPDAPNQEAAPPLLEDDGCPPPGHIPAIKQEKKSGEGDEKNGTSCSKGSKNREVVGPNDRLEAQLMGLAAMLADSSDDELASSSEDEFMRSFIHSAPPPPPPPSPPPPPPPFPTGLGDWASPMWPVAGTASYHTATSFSVGVFDADAAGGTISTQTDLQRAISQAARNRIDALDYVEEQFEDDPEDD